MYILELFEPSLSVSIVLAAQTALQFKRITEQTKTKFTIAS